MRLPCGSRDRQRNWKRTRLRQTNKRVGGSTKKTVSGRWEVSNVTCSLNPWVFKVYFVENTKIEVQSFVTESNQTSAHIPFYYRYSYPQEFLLTRKRLPFLLECSGDQLIPFPTPYERVYSFYSPLRFSFGISLGFWETAHLPLP